MNFLQGGSSYSRNFICKFAHPHRKNSSTIINFSQTWAFYIQVRYFRFQRITGNIKGNPLVKKIFWFDLQFFLSGSLDGKLRLWNIPDKKVALWNEVDGPTKLITTANFIQVRSNEKEMNLDCVCYQILKIILCFRSVFLTSGSRNLCFGSAKPDL